jgi:putative addiction module component (TIGR02574 family)
MTMQKSVVFDEAKKLPPIERAELIEYLLESFNDQQQKEIDEKWAKEAELRIDAYNAGKLEDLPISKVFEELEGGSEYK